MLAKLIKYEFKATQRLYWPMLGAMIVLALVNRVFYAGMISRIGYRTLDWLPRMLFALTSGLYALLVVGLFVVTLVVMVQRFYKNLLGDEGYLMLTLPLPVWMHTAAKAITTTVWLTVSMAVTLLSSLLLFSTPAQLGELRDELGMLLAAAGYYLGIPPVVLALEGILFFLLCAAAAIVQVYCAIAIGQLWHKHRILGGFAAYVGIGTATQVLFSVAVVIQMLANGIHTDPTVEMVALIFHQMIWILVLLSAAAGVICYAVTNWILSRHLNLE